jgi:hypothetical protein
MDRYVQAHADPVQHRFPEQCQLSPPAGLPSFLILSGVRTLVETDEKYRLLKVLPVVLPRLWLMFVLISRDRILIGVIMARYLLAAPDLRFLLHIP